MVFARRVAFEVLRVIAHGSISATYATAGTAFGHPMRMIRIVNNTDGDMFVAVTNGSTPASDGTADNFFVPAASFVLYDYAANGGPEGGVSPLSVATNSQVWVRQSTAPSKNSVYIECTTAAGD